jgi:RNA polymerase sigma-70 factor, ECF subfamily
MNGTDGTRESTWFEDGVISLLPDLLCAARSMVDRQADAEDLVAEAVARAWERRDDLRDRDRFRGWLFRILRNCFLSGRRRRKSLPDRVPFQEEGGEEAPFSLFDRVHQPFLLWSGDTEADFLNRLLKEDLQAAVQGLPEAYRDVVLLADVHGLRYAEIADALEIPVGTVRSRLARGRSRMQEALWRHAVDRGLRDPKPSSHETPR